MSEIKDLKEKSQKEDDVLLSISAGYRQPIIPQLEYEYIDRTIHEDLFNLVHFSCEEICSTKEQTGKVLRLWANFLELMLGVPPRAKGSDSVEVVVDTKHHSAFTSGEANVSSDAISLVSRQLKLAANGDEHASSGVSKHGGTGLLNKDSSGKENCKDGDPANKDVATCAEKPPKDQEIGNGTDKRSGDVDERVATSCAAFPSGVENNNGKVRSGDSSGIFRIELKPFFFSLCALPTLTCLRFTFIFKVHGAFYPNQVKLYIKLIPFNLRRYCIQFHTLIICS